MDKLDKKAIKDLAQSGAFKLLEGLAEEIKADFRAPEFINSSGETMYELGKTVGRREGIEIFLEEISLIAKE